MNQPDSRRRKRRIVLLISAILIPAAVLVTLSVQVIRQESELAETRKREERREALDQLRRELAARLQSVKLEEVNRLIGESGLALPAGSPIVFVAPLEQGVMTLPWEKKQTSPPPTPEFIKHRLDGESLEFRANDPAGAAEAYKQAQKNARNIRERCDAQLRLGRVLSKGGFSDEGARVYRAMLEQCGTLTDSDGISFGLYAAERLFTTGQDVEAARKYVLHNAGITQFRSPNEAYLLRSLLDALASASDPAKSRIASEIHDLEQIARLANEIQDRLGRLEFAFRSAPGDLSWIGYGDEPWLITVVSPTTFATPVVMAVSSSRVVPAGVTLRTGHTADSLPLGDGFIDLQAEWPAGRFASPGGISVGIYAAGLALMLGATLLAAYLLLRDVHREVQTAEMRSHFVASVSHELKTPLTAIRMFAETLMMGRASSKQATSDYLRTIVNESERLSRLVENVLDFSRIEQGRKIYRMEPTCLADVVRSAAQAMEYPLAQLGFTLALSIDDSIPSLQADADAIEQAVLNLLANAVKYSGDSRRIDLRVGHRGGEAFIDVVDQGLGISPQDQPRIFEKFFRVQSAETDRIAGTGLGLTLALHIVEAHKGRIEVSSAPGQGSTFSVRIPLQEPA